MHDPEVGGRRWFSFEGRRRSRSRRQSVDDDARTVAGGEVPDATWARRRSWSYPDVQEQDISLYSYIIEQQRIALDQQQYIYDAKAELQLKKKESFGTSSSFW